MIDSKYLTPKQIVEELDKYIIGQYDAKRNVAIALRNRWRRMHVKSDIQERNCAEQYSDDRSNRRGQNGDRPSAC